MKIINAGSRIVNTWLYRNDDGYVMIDTGYPGKLGSVERRLKRHGIGIRDIRYVFLTHAHDDHAGFLVDILKRNPNVRVIVNEKSISVLKKGQNPFKGGCSTKKALAFCRLMALWGKGEHMFPPFPDELLGRLLTVTPEKKKDAEDILNGEILFTPGHTADSISLKVNDIIFCGDAAMNGFPSTKNVTIWVEDMDAFGMTWERLLKEDCSILYPGHGKPFSVSKLGKNLNLINNMKLYPLRP